jgi:hypothetical protein
MGIMWLSKKTYHIGSDWNQTIVRLFNYPILFNKSPYGWSIRFGSPGIGLNVTTNPLFSVRNGYKKSIKLGKYYIVKL